MNYDPRKKSTKFERWTWTTTMNDHWGVYSASGGRWQRSTYNKWCRKLVRRKHGTYVIHYPMLYGATHKSIGARMGSGRGKLNYMYSMARLGSRLTSYSDCRYKKISKVSQFFKKSKLKLKLIKLKL